MLDLGDYYGCMQLSDTNYYKISLSISIVSTSIGICYYKKCDINYFNETLKNSEEIIIANPRLIFFKK